MCMRGLCLCQLGARARLSWGWTRAPSLALFLRSHQALLPNCISKCLTDKLRKGRVLIENTQDVQTQGERGAEGVGTRQTEKTNKDKGREAGDGGHVCQTSLGDPHSSVMFVF